MSAEVQPDTDSELRAEWERYEAANKAARVEYSARPTVRPWLDGHWHCLCCDLLTVQASAVCLSCQQRDPGWHAFAHDPEAIATLRRVNRRAPAWLRREL